MPKFIVISGKKQAGKTTTANFIKTYLEKEYVDVHKKEAEHQAKEESDRTGEWVIPSLVGRPTNLVQITSFAKPIKEFCEHVLGLSKSQIYGSDKDKNSDTHIRWATMPNEIRKRYGPLYTQKQKEEALKCHPRRFINWYDKERMPKSGPMTAREVMQIFGTDIMRKFFDYDIWAKAPFNKDWGSTKVVIIDDCRFPNEADISLENNGLLIRLQRNPLHDTHASEVAMDDYDESKYTHVIDNTLYKNIKCLESDVNRIMQHEGLMQ